MAGTPEQLIERFQAYGDVGMTYAIMYFAGVRRRHVRHRAVRPRGDPSVVLGLRPADG